jgi:hypothetical protein
MGTMLCRLRGKRAKRYRTFRLVGDDSLDLGIEARDRPRKRAGLPGRFVFEQSALGFRRFLLHRTRCHAGFQLHGELVAQ